MPRDASRHPNLTSSDRRESELRRQAYLLNQEIDAALAARRIKAQADEAAEVITPFQARSRAIFNSAVWFSTARVIGVLTVCVLM